MATNKIIVIGSANTDMVVKAKTLPLPGETLLGGAIWCVGMSLVLLHRVKQGRQFLMV